MEINKTAKAIHEMAREKGFWDRERNVGELLMLVVSELGEALEAHRKGRSATGTLPVLAQCEKDSDFLPYFKEAVKDTFQDEITDAVIRLFDIAEGVGFDLEQHIQAKMRYNSTREHKHGKAY